MIIKQKQGTNNVLHFDYVHLKCDINKDKLAQTALLKFIVWEIFFDCVNC